MPTCFYSLIILFPIWLPFRKESRQFLIDNLRRTKAQANFTLSWDFIYKIIIDNKTF